MEEEARLLRLRRETEGPVREEIREELQRARHELEVQASSNNSAATALSCYTALAAMPFWWGPCTCSRLTVACEMTRLKDA